MGKVITFSRSFPVYHPKAGQPTNFVEKVLKQFNVGYKHTDYFRTLLDLNAKNISLGKLTLNDIAGFYNSLKDIDCNKLHTIRSGNRFKKFDLFSPRCWFGKPYNSPQIIFLEDKLIHNTFDFEIKEAYKMLPLDYDTDVIINHNFYHTDDEVMKILAKNDGLSLAELLQWFKYPTPFKGQIICFNKNINY